MGPCFCSSTATIRLFYLCSRLVTDRCNWILSSLAPREANGLRRVHRGPISGIRSARDHTIHIEAFTGSYDFMTLTVDPLSLLILLKHSHRQDDAPCSHCRLGGYAP